MSSNEGRAARIAAICERAAARTPGRWRWRGNTSGHIVQLVAIDRLADYVLSFRRWGLQGTIPWFQRSTKESAGIERAKLIPRTHYDPYTIVGIDHPDARFIEHSPEDMDFLLAELEAHRKALAACLSEMWEYWREHGPTEDGQDALELACPLLGITMEERHIEWDDIPHLFLEPEPIEVYRDLRQEEYERERAAREGAGANGGE